MITSVLWAHLASRSDSALLSLRRHPSRLRLREAPLSPSPLRRGGVFILLVLAISLLAFAPSFVTALLSIEAIERGGLLISGAEFRTGLFGSLIGAFAVGLGIASFIWTLTDAPLTPQDRYESDERTR